MPKENEGTDKQPEIFISYSDKKLKEKNITIVLSEKNQTEKLTPTYLEMTIVPYLKALENLQNLLNKIQKKNFSDYAIKWNIDKLNKNHEFKIIYDDISGIDKKARILEGKPIILDREATLIIPSELILENKQFRVISISQNSPITITLEGAEKVLYALGDLILPSRRKLYEQEQKVKISEQKLKIKQEQEKLAQLKDLQKEKNQIELEKERLNLEEKRLDLSKKKMDMIINFMKEINPNLTEQEKMVYAMKLLPEIDTILTSPLELEILNNKK